MNEIEFLKRTLKQSEEERLKLHNSLLDVENKMNVLMNNIPDIVYMLDSNGFITYISEQVQMFGFSPDELAGSHFMDIVHPQDRPKATFKVNERRTGERSTKYCEIRLLKKEHVSNQQYNVTKCVKNAPVVAISAEGYYKDNNHNMVSFLGTIGIAHPNVKHDHIAASICGVNNSTEDISRIFLPICASCKKIRNDQGFWEQLEEYISSFFHVRFTHSICPQCAKELYPDIIEKLKI